MERGELLVSPQEHDAGEPLPHVHVRRRDVVRQDVNRASTETRRVTVNWKSGLNKG